MGNAEMVPKHGDDKRLLLLDRLLAMSAKYADLTAEQKLEKISMIFDHPEVGADGQMFIVQAIVGFV